MLWKTFEAMREEVMCDWWGMHNVEINNLYSSPNIIQVIRSRTIRWGKACDTYIYIHTHTHSLSVINIYTYIQREERGI